MLAIVGYYKLHETTKIDVDDDEIGDAARLKKYLKYLTWKNARTNARTVFKVRTNMLNRNCSHAQKDETC